MVCKDIKFFAGVALVAGLAGYALPHGNNVFVPTIVPAQVATVCHPVVSSVPDLVEALFACDPDGWSADEFHASYRDGMRVWVANSDYGIAVEKDGGTWGGAGAQEDVEGKRRIWAAYQKWASVKLLRGYKP